MRRALLVIVVCYVLWCLLFAAQRGVYLRVVCDLVFIGMVRCLVFGVCCLMVVVVWCSVRVACCSLFALRCLVYVGRCFVAGCLLFVDYCWLFGVRWLLTVVW